MRVLIVSTSERVGGAAVAANRLTEALNNNGVKVKMLVRDKQTDHITTVTLPASWRNRWHFLWERFVIWKNNGFDRKNLFAVDIANAGTDITRLPEFKEADIIHLHWVNQGMLSLKVIRKILASGKPVVWTMHDMWPCTGICHYARECTGYHDACGQCFYLRFPKDKDLSHRVFMEKLQTYAKAKIHFVTCSHWLEDKARKSRLLMGHDIRTIHNALNTSLFHPALRQEARRQLGLPLDKKLILFGSVKITEKRKGIDYFVEACRLLGAMSDEAPTNSPRGGEQGNAKVSISSPSGGVEGAKVSIVVFGNHSSELESLLPFPVYSLGYISGEPQMAKVYNAVDAYVTPSLEDNLPNTIAEASACGTPCVGFRIGGIPEMIDHKVNGYVAEYRKAEDLARGIRWVLEEADSETLRENVRHKAVTSYGESHIAKQYIRLYEELCK